MSAFDKVRALLNDPFRGKVLRQTVPDFVALVELMLEEEAKWRQAQSTTAVEMQRKIEEQIIARNRLDQIRSELARKESQQSFLKKFIP